MTDLPMNEEKINKVRAQDLEVFFTDHYPDAAVLDEAVHDLFRYPTSDTVHLVRAQEGLGEYDSNAAAQWLTGERGGDAATYPDDLFSYLAAKGKIPFGEYLVIFE
jgi:hypothetical protein